MEQKKKLNEPKELGIKIGSKEESFWTDIKDKIKGEITNHLHQITINNSIIELAESKIKEEKEKSKL